MKLVIYIMKTGKPILYNKMVMEKLPKEILEFAGDGNGLNPSNFLSYVVIRIWSKK